MAAGVQEDAPVKLRWHHTEFGRRTDCETYRIVREGEGWQLLDADWTPIGPWSPTIGAALNQADRVAARAAAKCSTRNVSEVAASSQK